MTTNEKLMVLCILLFFLVKEILLKAPGKSIKKMKNEKIHSNDWAVIRSFHDFSEENMTTPFQCGEKKTGNLSILVDIMIFYSMEDN